MACRATDPEACFEVTDRALQSVIARAADEFDALAALVNQWPYRVPRVADDIHPSRGPGPGGRHDKARHTTKGELGVDADGRPGHSLLWHIGRSRWFSQLAVMFAVELTASETELATRWSGASSSMV